MVLLTLLGNLFICYQFSCNSTVMMVAKASETGGRLMIYVKAYFNGVHFLLHYESKNIKNFLRCTSSEAEITRWVQWLGVPGFDSRQGSGIFLPSKTSKPFLGPVRLLFSGLRDSFLRGQGAGSGRFPFNFI
jgi:hypothetical protein